MGGMVVRECCDAPSNFRYTKTMNETFEELDIPAISGVDTRMITRIIRNEGTQRAAIVDINMSHDEAMELIRTTELKGQPLGAHQLQEALVLTYTQPQVGCCSTRLRY